MMEITHKHAYCKIFLLLNRSKCVYWLAPNFKSTNGSAKVNAEKKIFLTERFFLLVVFIWLFFFLFDSKKTMQKLVIALVLVAVAIFAAQAQQACKYMAPSRFCDAGLSAFQIWSTNLYLCLIQLNSTKLGCFGCWFKRLRMFLIASQIRTSANCNFIFNS